MENIDQIYKILGIVVIVLAPVLWFARLESKVMNLEREHEKDYRNLESDYNKEVARLESVIESHKASVKEGSLTIWRKIDDLQHDQRNALQSLARIEEALKHILKE